MEVIVGRFTIQSECKGEFDSLVEALIAVVAVVGHPL